ncbi:hypothetical protein NPIL_92091 [Nephila pilipes]|uniref:Uncharacterized protein n=1 Tax=Nephila pilipes TaxID=299642 RepID=A0A8X6TSD9_NEPPI|nr:hypothetical protein NPIL_92091 [Nephila pilipes]
MWVARRPEVSCFAGGIFLRRVELFLDGNKGMVREMQMKRSWNATRSKDSPGDVAQGKIYYMRTSVLMDEGTSFESEGWLVI